MNCYNLLNIPYFNETLKTYKVNENCNNYYSIDEYSTKENNSYFIIKYNKELLSFDLVSTYGLLRSVILSGNKVVSFAPPKSLSADAFINRYPLKDNTIVAEEFIEGTMINLFYDANYSCWQIATKNTVGGLVSFYQWSKTFRQMFDEACLHCELDIQSLDTAFCYSFVLQHPENRIVVPIKTPQLYLVAVYEIKQSSNSLLVVEHDKSAFLETMSKVSYPLRYEFATYTDLINTYASPNTPYYTLGVIIKNTCTGERTKIRNPIYEEVRHLRGNQPKLQYQYLTLRHSGKLAEFLKYYPETKDEMSKFRDQVHMFTNTLHKNYISCYVKKEKPLKDFSSQYRTHMFKLHQIFIDELREKKLFVTNTVVIKYVNELHPSLLMYCLNYNMRKNAIDVTKTKNNM
jgi:hypothetical protein